MWFREKEQRMKKNNEKRKSIEKNKLEWKRKIIKQWKKQNFIAEQIKEQTCIF